MAAVSPARANALLLGVMTFAQLLLMAAIILLGFCNPAAMPWYIVFGGAVLVATHDVEFVASTADRVVVLAEGEIVADGATADVVVASPVFAPQVAKITIPDRWLTVAQVAHALDQTAST